MKNHIYVKDKYRKNPLSFEPGGHNVTIVYSNGFSQTYDKVKSPKAFISKISDDPKRISKIVSIVVDGKQFTEEY
jgi:hypothetical protein